ncbi:MAG: large repetitive protein, partial [Actinoplanes sp.]|nr:large repetitive protein [Actinoplanes sp.]
MVLDMAPPDDAALSATGPTLSVDGLLTWLMSGLALPAGWTAPRAAQRPTGPRQPSGTAVGHSHTAPSSATRAGRGAGRKPGKGKGELPAVSSRARKPTIGLSGGGGQGFEKATSVAVPGRSTATSTYYANADGSHTRILSTGPVNYRSGATGWHPIDTTLGKAADGRWHERANSLQVQLGAYADDPRLVSVTLDATHSLSQRLIGAAHVPGVSAESTVTFAGALPHTDVQVQATRTGDEESIVLRDASAASTWDFALDLHGLAAAAQTAGSIVLKNATGKALVTIPAGYAWDSAPAPPGPATTHAVKYTLDGSALHVSLDPAWLHDPARVFPITVDPIYGSWAMTTYAESGIAPADRSNETVMKIGTADNGAHVDRSFLTFPDLGLEDSGVSITAASLNLFDIWAASCTQTQFDVASVTEAFSPSSVRTYPGPAFGPSIGHLLQTPTKACTNTSKNPTVGDDMVVPLSTGTFVDWSTGKTPQYGLGIFTTVTTGTTNQKWFASAVSELEWPSLSLTYTGFALPTVLTQNPANGAAAGTLTPTLSAIGDVGRGVINDAKFRYQIYNANGTKVADSGVVTAQYTVPAGKLQWGQIYSWSVQAYDGTNYSINPKWFQLNTQVPQPAVTGGLSQNPGHGFDASIGNYTTSSTDADIATVGPPLSVVRSYNSRDPRTAGAFGSAWSSVLDARAAERYNPDGSVSTVVLTYPDGSDVAYGRNADGSFTVPSGRAATLIHLSNGYELIDKSVTTYAFTHSLATGAYGITSITDANKREVTFAWSSGYIATLTSGTSGRALHLNWETPTGATAMHVTRVVTDPATAGGADTYTWTYGYAADQLTSVCPPGTTTACTKYGYDPHAAAQTRNEVLDLGAQSYWPLAEKSGGTAASAVTTNEGTDDATYTSASLGITAGPLASSSSTALTLNGTSTRVNLPDLKLSSSIAHSISLWFKAAAGTPAGVLWSTSDIPIATTAESGNTMPTLYLGTDGKLLGEFWISSADYSANPITTSGSVADGKWHNVVLTDSQAKQYMFLDGKQVGSIGGWGTLGRSILSPSERHYNYLGTGYLGPSVDGNGVWPDQPHTDASKSTIYGSYFKGSMADAAFFEGKTLTLADETAIYHAGLRPDALMTSANRPSGKAYSTVDYDPDSAAVTSVTDENGGSWGLMAPTTTGSSQVYRGAVLGADPLAYYRLGDAASASRAYSEVNYATAGYANVTLGAPGPFEDSTAATFNGTSSSVSVPGTVFANPASAQELWFKTSPTTTGEVLLSSQAGALGGTTCPCRPALWVTSDGMLRGLSPSTTPTGPLTSMGLPGKCLDDPSGSTTDGTKVQVYTCNGTQPQNWVMQPDGALRVLGKCMSTHAGGTASGTLIEISTCNGSAGQIWQAFAGGLRNPGSGLCLNDPMSSTTNGTQFELYACNSGNAQTWVQSLVSEAAITDGGWHHALLTADGTSQQLYVDGRLAGSSIGSEPLRPIPQTGAFLGGGYTGTATTNATSATGLAPGATRYFKGSIAEAAFYPTGLTAADAAAHYTAAKNSTGTTPLTSVTVTDPGGKSLVNRYDPLNGNRQVASVDGLGNVTSFGYDTGGFQRTVTDPNGNVTTIGHDANGNVVSTTTCQDRKASACSTQYATYQPNSMGVDVAVKATVTSSSAATTTGLTTAAAVDGNTASVSGALGFESALQTTAANTQWLQADLGTVKTVDQVVLYPRTDVAGGFPLTFTIQVSADGTTWKTETTQTNYAVPAAGRQATFTFTPLAARYVKLNATALRASPTSGKFSLDLAELSMLNDRPDPLAGVQLTRRDGRSASASDTTYLTRYDYDSLGDATAVTTPPVDGFPNGRTTTIDYT